MKVLFVERSFTQLINYNQHLVYWYKLINGELFTVMEHLHIHDHSINENMLKLSLMQGHEWAIKVKDKEKKINLLENLDLILPASRNEFFIHFTHNKSYGYILQFLLQNMCVKE